MLLKGKIKEEFEKWAIKQENICIEDRIHLQVNGGYGSVSFYYSTPESMQYGMYVDFFDSVGIVIIVAYDNTSNLFNVYLDDNGKSYFPFRNVPTRREAREQAIKKAIEIYNKRQYERPKNKF